MGKINGWMEEDTKRGEEDRPYRGEERKRRLERKLEGSKGQWRK